MNATTNGSHNTRWSPVMEPSEQPAGSIAGRIIKIVLLMLFGAYMGLCMASGDGTEGSVLSTSISALLSGNFAGTVDILGTAMSESRGVIGAILGALSVVAMYLLVQNPRKSD